MTRPRHHVPCQIPKLLLILLHVVQCTMFRSRCFPTNRQPKLRHQNFWYFLLQRINRSLSSSVQRSPRFRSSNVSRSKSRIPFGPTSHRIRHSPNRPAIRQTLPQYRLRVPSRCLVDRLPICCSKLSVKFEAIVACMKGGISVIKPIGNPADSAVPTNSSQSSE